jgi:hypothetical protein
MHRIGVLVFLCCLAIGMARAGAAQSVAGTWSGMLNFTGAPILLVIDIKDSGNGLTATETSPYQDNLRIPIDSIAAANGTLTFAIARLGVTFTGAMSPSAISGTFTQRGTSIPLVLTPSSIGTGDLAGTWLGMLKAGGAALPLAFHLTDGPGATLTATIDSPSQKAFGIPVNASRANGVLTLKIPSLGVSYNGTIGAATIAGTFVQGGLSVALTLGRPGTIAISTAPEATPVPTPLPNFRAATFRSPPRTASRWPER